MCKISLYLAQSLALFFRLLALCQVHHDTHEFDDIAGRVENRMTCSVHVFRRTVWKNDSEMRIKIVPRAACAVEVLQDPGSIFWMDSLMATS